MTDELSDEQQLVKWIIRCGGSQKSRMLTATIYPINLVPQYCIAIARMYGPTP